MRQAINEWAARLSAKPAAQAAEQATPPPPAKSAQEIIDEVLLAHPEMNAATTINTLKAKGLEIVKAPGLEAPADEETKEGEGPLGILAADTSSANAQMLRSESMQIVAPMSLRESDPAPTVGGVRSQPKNEVTGWTKFKAVMIQEGLGNFGTAFFYTKEALQSAVSVFEGRKIYADHPSKSEEEDRPERSVRDVLGHFENVHYVENEAGQGELVADVVILPDEPFEWARALMRHAHDYAKKYPDKSFIGLSINAMGDAIDTPTEKIIESTSEPIRQKLLQALEMGIESVRVCSKITDAISCDLVTEAGAGGKVTQLIEGERMDKKEEMEKQADQKDPSQLAPEAKQNDEEGHDDAAKDLELILSVLDKMGLTEEPEREEAKKLALEAYECMKAEGMGEGAIHGVEGVLRMAKKEMAKKAAEADAEKSDDMKDEEKKEMEEGVKESARLGDLEKENLELKAKLQAFEQEKEKAELESFIDSKLAESKLSRATTKAFREAAGEIRTREDFEAKFKIWTDAQKLAGERAPLRLSFTEKAAASETGSVDAGGKLDFSKLI